MMMAAGGRPLGEAFDLPLVVLSVAIAIAGAYVALTLGERVATHRGKVRYLWLGGGAVAFGSAVWAMHFTGMLALRLPIAVTYDIPTVVLSFVAAVVAAAVALYTTSRPKVSWTTSLCAAVAMGAGIGGMHYIGMFAMRMPATMAWNLQVVALSVVVAIVLSLVALRLSIRLRAASGARVGWHRVAAAVVMGLAIACMHYTGMGAATFFGGTGEPSNGMQLGSNALGVAAIAFITLVVLGFAALLAVIDRRFVAQDSALMQSQRRLGMVVANAPVVLFAFDATGIITIVEGRRLTVLGHAAESMIGHSIFEICANVPALVEQARRALRGEEHTALSTIDGVILETHWTPVFAAGHVDSVVAVANDVTKRHRAEVALQHQALHDALTGLPNRAFLNERLAEVMDAAGKSRDPLALALIDLDRFKDVNDTMGHDVGDTVLQEVAQRLRGVLREQDLVARFGGDEFAVLLPHTVELEAIAIVARLRDALSAPCVINGRSIDVGGSIGLAVSPPHGPSPAALLRKADVAMYAAKRSGGGWVLYDAALDHLEEQLRTALDDGEFTLVYQPIYELGGALRGAEALLRWTPADGEPVQPNDFIPYAEESGLIVPIGAWVLNTACAQNAAWHRAGQRLVMSVNVSTKQIADPSFVRTVQEALHDSGLDPTLLELELTETAISANIDRVAAVVNDLRALGVRIAVDDFGTGYNSLATLRWYEVDTLKLDRCFVTDITENSVDRAIASAVITAAHALGACVVAEGIETAEQLATLIALKSDFGQGYLFSKPVSPEAFAALPVSGTVLAAA
ncbi:MAG TPA: EAL domain-containing protein [Candidatus Elarobacter sp.]|jgi:diguanylate cyclase (GGDEF)-like protein/PAS domain S-box-containing protein|nr:EAL domain-containing protein [Candidatus Elarobacter sp.]